MMNSLFDHLRHWYMIVCVFLRPLKLSFTAVFTSIHSHVVGFEYSPNSTDDCISAASVPQIPEFTQTATWPTCDAGPGPTAKSPLGKSPTRRSTVLRGPERSGWRRENRGPQQKQVRRGAQAALGLGLFQQAGCRRRSHFQQCISFSPHPRRTWITALQWEEHPDAILSSQMTWRLQLL